MNRNCPHKDCPTTHSSCKIVRYGFYFRTSDSRKIRRFKCLSCGRTFSNATFQRAYNQNKRRVNLPLFRLLASNTSMRRCAKLLRIDKKTVARKIRFLALIAGLSQAEFLKRIKNRRITEVQFDDLETFLHTKLKPLSIALAVDARTRIILDFQVSEMPAKGHLAKRALQKYGHRKDKRHQGWDQMFRNLAKVLPPDVRFKSDSNPHYGKYVKKYFPEAKHEQVMSRKSSVVGQGELKKVGFDPIFSLNHTCAMLRANINRLNRKTWCTTKTIAGLRDHIQIYVDFHNQCLLQK